MRITREAELAPAKSAPQQRTGGHGYHNQRNKLLPIHKGKHNLETTVRNGEFLAGARQENVWFPARVSMLFGQAFFPFHLFADDLF